ncbi:hypothetical protein B0I72DRAFT_136254 [Yarrowia lipolytica]|nr:hypothetical protein B0I72DRAFT_136254 [Yarrowia lipolytica]
MTVEEMAQVTPSSPPPVYDAEDDESRQNLLHESRDSSFEIEQFELDDSPSGPLPGGSHPNASTSTLARAQQVAQNVATYSSKLFTPVKQLLDPVARFWHKCSVAMDVELARWGNPLILKRLVYLVFVSTFVILAILFGLVPNNRNSFGLPDAMATREDLLTYMREVLESSEMKSRLDYMSSMTHAAGTSGDLTLAKYVANEFKRYNLDNVEVKEIKGYVVMADNGQVGWEVVGEQGNQKREDQFGQTPEENSVPAFMANSHPGEAEGHAIFANYGTDADFKALEAAGIKLEGAIVFVAYNNVPTGLKVQTAQYHGAAAVVVFSNDPENADAVRRDTTTNVLMSPGFVNFPGGPRSYRPSKGVDPGDATAGSKIPVVPASLKDVAPVLQKLKSGARYDNDGVRYSGDDKSNVRIKVRNNVKTDEQHPLWNVFGRIEGNQQPDLNVIVGSARDAACFGAMDPMSGQIVMLEAARIISGMTQHLQWYPERTITFASWDGSKQGFAGSNERPIVFGHDLCDETTAYINVADAVTGSEFQAHGHPYFNNIVRKALVEVKSPQNESFVDHWPEKRVKQFRQAGDYMGLLSTCGIPSIDVGFKGSSFPHDTCKDTVGWRDEFLPDSIDYLKAMVEIVVRLALSSADDPVLPIDTAYYASEMRSYVDDLIKYSEEADPNFVHDFRGLDAAVARVETFSQKFIDATSQYSEITRAMEFPNNAAIRHSNNIALRKFESRLLEPRSPEEPRSWAQHCIFSPQAVPQEDFEWYTFGNIRDQLRLKRHAKAQELMQNAAHRIYKIYGNI